MVFVCFAEDDFFGRRVGAFVAVGDAVLDEEVKADPVVAPVMVAVVRGGLCHVKVAFVDQMICSEVGRLKIDCIFLSRKFDMRERFALTDWRNLALRGENVDGGKTKNKDHVLTLLKVELDGQAVTKRTLCNPSLLVVSDREVGMILTDFDV